MNQKKLFPVAVAVLVIIILAIIYVLLRQEGIIGRQATSTSASESAVIELVVVDGQVTDVPVADFDAYVSKATLPVFVDFWAEWCPPCREAAPFVKQLAIDYQGSAHIVKVNVDMALALARKYNAQSIPLFAVFVDGKVVDSTAGYAEALEGSLRQMIEDQIP